MATLKLTDALRAEYKDMFQHCVTNPGRDREVESLVGKLIGNKARYQAVGGPLALPWSFVAVIHNMEASQSFNRHLHNGDPLTARTTHVPAGRPKTGQPPFTWEASAADALSLDGFDKWTDWSVAGTLYKIECFNGTGYRLYHPSVKTPYLWGYSNWYVRGKYVADGTWSPSAVSSQCGAAVLLRRMAEKGEAEFSDEPAPTQDIPLVVPFAARKPSSPAVLAQATALQAWLNTHPGIFVKADGWAGSGTSEAFKAVTGHYLPGDPRG